MSWVMRTLTVILGLLIALGGGAVVLNRTGSRSSRATTAAAVGDTRVRPSTTEAGSTTTVAAATTTVPSTSAPTGPPTTRTTVTTVPVPPLVALTSSLDTAVAGTNSCLVVEDSTGHVLYQHQPDVAVIPASTQKLLVAAAALDTLGPNYRFTTQVVAPATPVNGQVSALWLVGHGDPLLATPEYIASQAGRARVTGYPWTPLSTLADGLATAGVTAVAGGIRGDDSYEDQLRFLPVWPAAYQQQNQIGLLSALNVDEGIQLTPPPAKLVPDPPAFAASELARLLAGHHVAAGAGPDQTAPPGGVVLASVSSAPLSQIVAAMLRASDNWIAELLTRAIDKASGGTGTTAGGTAVVIRDAAQAGIPLTGAVMNDGSGLSRSDRATCRELLAALDLGHQPADAAILDGLAVAAQTGTLAARFQGTPLAGKLRAKTGSLDGVGGMVGIVAAPTEVHFSFVENDLVTDTVLYARQDAVAFAIGAFSRTG